MNDLNVSAAPHINSGVSTRNIMLDVIIALIPASIMGIIYFGWKAILIIALCVGTAVLAEFLFNLITRRKQTIGDLSAVVTGLILALNLSVNVGMFECIIGSLFAIIIVKCLFGGIGKNIANPAIAARVFMLLTFSSVALAPHLASNAITNGIAGALDVELTAGATPLSFLNNGAGTEGTPSLLTLLVGLHGGTIGETCAIALLIGFIYLMIRKVIKWYIPVTFVGTVFILYLLTSKFNAAYALSHVLAGGLLFGAIFMATDYVTSPISNLGKVIFGVGCGLITFLIRKYGAFPEGVSISILCMNLLVPLIEKITTPKTLGGIR